MSVARVGVVLPDLGGGGVQRVLANLAGGLTARGIEVVLFTLEAGAPITPVPHGVTHVALDGFGWPGATIRLRSEVRRRRPGALIGGITRANLAVLAAAQGTTRAILTKHLPVDMLSRSPVRRRALGLVLRHAYPRADAVVAVSIGTFDSLVQLGLPRARLHRIANPVLGPEFEARRSAPVDDPWLAPAAPPVVLGVGRLVPQKDFGTLVAAFGRLRDRSPARLLILGDGPERDVLRRQAYDAGIADRVRLAGHVPDPVPYMARSAVLASTSRWEGLPTVLIEGLAAGTTVVASDCRTGPREILEDGALGRLVPVGDADATARALLEALEQPSIAPAERLARYRTDEAVSAYLRVMEGA